VKLDNSIAAVVTGGASGLGAETACALARLGVRVAIFDRDVERGRQLAGEHGLIFAETDISSEESVADAFAIARKTNGQERILVNCAGIVAGAKTVGRNRETGERTSFPLDLFDKVVTVNLIGTFRCIVASAAGMAALDPMEDGERGAIVNTASIAAVEGQLGQAAYSASKAGVVGLTLPVARDLAASGIRVNAILPGIMRHQ
jgi:NAD(P)-dependent dehydrogenase (short-subunit alcohol dehydrogenase family)